MEVECEADLWLNFFSFWLGKILSLRKKIFFTRSLYLFVQIPFFFLLIFLSVMNFIQVEKIEQFLRYFSKCDKKLTSCLVFYFPFFVLEVDLMGFMSVIYLFLVFITYLLI